MSLYQRNNNNVKSPVDKTTQILLDTSLKPEKPQVCDLVLGNHGKDKEYYEITKEKFIQGT